MPHLIYRIAGLSGDDRPLVALPDSDLPTAWGQLLDGIGEAVKEGDRAVPRL